MIYAIQIGNLDTDKPNWIYDTSSDYWANYKKGPRPLTKAEQDGIERLKDDIEDLRKVGADISVEFLGKKIDSVVGIPAGVAPNSKWINFYSQIGYDILTLKTVRDAYLRG